MKGCPPVRAVPTENLIRFENTSFATIHAIIATHDELRAHCFFCCTCLKFSNQRFSAGRDTRPSPPIGGSSGQRAALFAPQAFRPRAMGFVVAMVSGLAPVSANRSTCNSDRLAPQSLCVVLDPEIAAPTGKTASNGGDSCFDPAHESDQSIVGSAAHSWGAAEVGNRGGGIHGCQVYGASPQAAFANLADIPE